MDSVPQTVQQRAAAASRQQNSRSSRMGSRQAALAQTSRPSTEGGFLSPSPVGYQGFGHKPGTADSMRTGTVSTTRNSIRPCPPPAFIPSVSPESRATARSVVDARNTEGLRRVPFRAKDKLQMLEHFPLDATSLTEAGTGPPGSAIGIGSGLTPVVPQPTEINSTLPTVSAARHQQEVAVLVAAMTAHFQAKLRDQAIAPFDRMDWMTKEEQKMMHGMDSAEVEAASWHNLEALLASVQPTSAELSFMSRTTVEGAAGIVGQPIAVTHLDDEANAQEDPATLRRKQSRHVNPQPLSPLALAADVHNTRLDRFAGEKATSSPREAGGVVSPVKSPGIRGYSPRREIGRRSPRQGWTGSAAPIPASNVIRGTLSSPVRGDLVTMAGVESVEGGAISFASSMLPSPPQVAGRPSPSQHGVPSDEQSSATSKGSPGRASNDVSKMSSLKTPKNADGQAAGPGTPPPPSFSPAASQGIASHHGAMQPPGRASQDGGPPNAVRGAPSSGVGGSVSMSMAGSVAATDPHLSVTKGGQQPAGSPQGRAPPMPGVLPKSYSHDPKILAAQLEREKTRTEQSNVVQQLRTHTEALESAVNDARALDKTAALREELDKKMGLLGKLQLEGQKLKEMTVTLSNRLPPSSPSGSTETPAAASSAMEGSVGATGITSPFATSTRSASIASLSDAPKARQWDRRGTKQGPSGGERRRSSSTGGGKARRRSSVAAGVSPDKPRGRRRSTLMPTKDDTDRLSGLNSPTGEVESATPRSLQRSTSTSDLESPRENGDRQATASSKGISTSGSPANEGVSQPPKPRRRRSSSVSKGRSPPNKPADPARHQLRRSSSGNNLSSELGGTRSSRRSSKSTVISPPMALLDAPSGADDDGEAQANSRKSSSNSQGRQSLTNRALEKALAAAGAKKKAEEAERKRKSGEARFGEAAFSADSIAQAAQRMMQQQALDQLGKLYGKSLAEEETVANAGDAMFNKMERITARMKDAAAKLISRGHALHASHLREEGKASSVKAAKAAAATLEDSEAAEKALFNELQYELRAEYTTVEALRKTVNRQEAELGELRQEMSIMTKGDENDRIEMATRLLFSNRNQLINTPGTPTRPSSAASSVSSDGGSTQPSLAASTSLAQSNDGHNMDLGVGNDLTDILQDRRNVGMQTTEVPASREDSLSLIEDMYQHDVMLGHSLKNLGVAIANMLQFQNSVNVETSCHSCLNPLTLASVLPCGHSFCQNCIRTTMYHNADMVECAECFKASDLGYVPNQGVETVLTACEERPAVTADAEGITLNERLALFAVELEAAQDDVSGSNAVVQEQVGEALREIAARHEVQSLL